MKKGTFIILTAFSLLAFSCNSDSKTESSKGEKPEVTPSEVTAEKVVEKNDTALKDRKIVSASTEDKATAEMCACINSSLKGMSPKIQQIFIRAGNSDRPLQILQNEIVTISDQEQMELFEQLQRFSTEPQLQKCSENIRKKYGLDDNDKAAQEKVLKAARMNKDCELVYALIKIGMQQQTGAGTGN